MIRISSGQRELKRSKPSEKIFELKPVESGGDTRNLPSSTVPPENPTLGVNTLELETNELQTNHVNNKAFTPVELTDGLNSGRRESVEAWTISKDELGKANTQDLAKPNFEQDSKLLRSQESIQQLMVNKTTEECK